MISSTLLTLIVIPAIYAAIKGTGLPRPVRRVPETRTERGLSELVEPFTAKSHQDETA
jgi:hypothetical protein